MLTPTHVGTRGVLEELLDRRVLLLDRAMGSMIYDLSLGVGEDAGRRDVTFDQMVEAYAEQVRALVAGGVDLLLAETSFDTLVMKACLVAVARFFEETGTRLPVMISGTIFPGGRTLSAQPVEA